jgi:hypothetical protein
MAYRAVDHYVYERVRQFLKQRHKMKSRGRLPLHRCNRVREVGVLRLRDVARGAPGG